MMLIPSLVKIRQLVQKLTDHSIRLSLQFKEIRPKPGPSVTSGRRLEPCASRRVLGVAWLLTQRADRLPESHALVTKRGIAWPGFQLGH
jgi:hypothetical protein